MFLKRTRRLSIEEAELDFGTPPQLESGIMEDIVASMVNGASMLQNQAKSEFVWIRSANKAYSLAEETSPKELACLGVFGQVLDAKLGMRGTWTPESQYPEESCNRILSNFNVLLFSCVIALSAVPEYPEYFENAVQILKVLAAVRDVLVTFPINETGLEIKRLVSRKRSASDPPSIALSRSREYVYNVFQAGDVVGPDGETPLTEKDLENDASGDIVLAAFSMKHSNFIPQGDSIPKRDCKKGRN